MKKLILVLLLSLTVIPQSIAQPANQAKNSDSQEKNASREEAPVPLREYREILEKERKLIDEQAERHFARLNGLLDRVIWGLGVLAAFAVGLIAWLGISTRRELQAELKRVGLSAIKLEDVQQLVEQYRHLKQEVAALTAYKNAKITWIFSGETTLAYKEIAALNSLGIRNIELIAPKNSGDLQIPASDLVIFSFDANDEARERLKKIIDQLKAKDERTYLLIYCAPGQLTLDDQKKLAEFSWSQAVNFPTRLVADVQVLLRKGHL